MQPVQPDGPPLWVIETDSKRTWLFGTIHWLPPEQSPRLRMVRRISSRLGDPMPAFPWRNSEVRYAMRRSRTLVLEIVDFIDHDRLLELVWHTGAGVSEGPLFDRLASADRQRVEHALEQRALERALGEQHGALEILLALTAFSPLTSRFDGYGVDLWLLKEARHIGMRTLGLETPESRLAIIRDSLFSMSEAERAEFVVAFLDASIDAGDSYEEDLTHLYALWLSGDIDVFDRAMEQFAGRHPALHEALIVERNRVWLETLLGRIGNGRDEFVAIGIGHLTGPENLRDMLAAQGFEAHRVR